MSKRQHPALVYVLKALLPYSREGMLLAFKPNRFFNELERLSGYPNKTLRNAYQRGAKSGLIQANPRKAPRLTARGRDRLQPFIATKLPNGGKLMVIFDIPEAASATRRQFRLNLRRLEFKQVQQSVWITRYDQRKIVEQIVSELGLTDCVQLYEAARLFP